LTTKTPDPLTLPTYVRDAGSDDPPATADPAAAPADLL
jgi:hypothetical protein